VAPAVKHNGLAFELQKATGATDLIARAQRDKLQRLIALEGERAFGAAFPQRDVGNGNTSGAIRGHGPIQPRSHAKIHHVVY
jgi:hypothetical protein